MLTSLSLAGSWDFALDPDGLGERAGWAAGRLGDSIVLPGSVDQAKKTPLTTGATMAHLSRRHPYVGRAWYGRDVEITADAAPLYQTLVLERPHGEVTLWLDGRRIGRDESLSTACRFFLGRLAPGTHRLVLRVDNDRLEAVGDAIAERDPDVAHSKTEHTQTNWNGVVGRLALEGSLASIARVEVHAPSRRLRVRVELDAYDPDIEWPSYWTAPHADVLELTIRLAGGETIVHSEAVRLDSAHAALDIALDLPAGAALWDEFDPAVHRLELEWRRDGTPQDRFATGFGIRSFTVRDRRFHLNGRPVFLRGTLDCCIFPLTGYPPTDHEGWRKVFGTVQAYGLNHVRFHSWCPPEAAFAVADELGLLLHVETPVWPVLGQDPALDRYILGEAERIVAAYGNHPSFVMLAVGNEVHGAGLHAFLERFVAAWRTRDPRRLYSGGSGWPTTMRADYVSKPEPRNQRWGEGLDGRLNARPLETRTDWSAWRDSVPMALVSHEAGQWCVYPDLAEIEKYTGVLEARNLLAVRDDLADKGRLGDAEAMLMASGRLQTQLYKEEMEAALRTRGLAGTQLLGLQDFPGQGTALVGVVDAFWDRKPYVTPDAFRRFAGPVVPLLRADGFILVAGASFAADLQLAQFGPTGLSGPLAWTLADCTGDVVRRGRTAARQWATGELHDAGPIAIDTTGLPAPGRYRLTVMLEDTSYANGWDLWIFEPDLKPLSFTTADRLTPAVLSRLANGETIVLTPPPAALRPNAVLGHTTVFWNTLWTGGQPPHTLGLLVDTDHPLFAHFPTDRHADWHWFELTHRRRAFDIAGIAFRPVVRVIDDWNENRDLVLLAEARAGAGRLVLCAADLATDLATRHVARSFRNGLAAALAAPADDLPEVSLPALGAWWQRIAAEDGEPGA